jgi:MFS family permease
MGFVVLAVVMGRLKIPPIPRGALGSPIQDIKDGLSFIRLNSIFSFLIGMTFFNSFFGMAYVMLMPIFAVDILDVGAKGQGMLLGMSGAGALVNTLWMGARGTVPNRGLAIIGGAVLFGLAVAAFALTSEYVGSLALGMGLMFVVGLFNSVYMISIQSSLQIMVPDRMRGRVMGFYGMTWSIMPLGGMQASVLTSLFTAPIAIAAGGLVVALFALGQAVGNPTVRNLRSNLRPIEDDGEDDGIEALDQAKAR